MSTVTEDIVAANRKLAELADRLDSDNRKLRAEVGRLKAKIAAKQLKEGDAKEVWISDSSLSNRLKRALKMRGIQSVPGLASLSERDILGMKYVGRRSVAEVRELLRKYGMALRGEDEA